MKDEAAAGPAEENAALRQPHILILSISFLEFLAVIMFQALDQFIECHGDRTENDDGCDHHVELEEKSGGYDRS